jgi:hypothetical protein
MLIRAIKNTLIVGLVALVQLALVPNLGYPYYFLNVMVVALVFIGVLYTFKRAIGFSIAFGVIADLFTPLFFTSAVIGFVITFSLLRFIFQKFFTNKSYYVVLFLIIFSSILYHYILNAMHFIYKMIMSSNVDITVLWSAVDTYQLLWMVGMNAIVGTAAFWLFYYSSNKFHTAILGR